MKLVIDIDDEEYYDLMKKSKQHSIDMFTKAQSSIIKGAPLDAVLDEIRAEIENIEYLSCPQPDVVLNDVLQIIDKYRGQKEGDGE